MAKRKKKGSRARAQSAVSDVKKKKSGKRGARIQFLRDLYGNDPEISNEKALRLLLKKFPESKANLKAIVTWKNMLRAEGFNIPKLRTPKKKREVATKKKKSSRRG